MILKVLSIGSDRNLFVADSEAQKRIKEYGKLFDELHIVVFSTQKSEIRNPKSEINYLPARYLSMGNKIQIGNNIFIYSTNSKSKWFYIWDAYQLAKLSIVNCQLSIVTCQDPFESGLVGWLLKLRYKLPLQLQVHTDIFSPYFAKESLLNRLRVLLAKFLLPRADGIRVVSERIKQSLASNVKCQMSNVSTLPVFVDVKKIQSAEVKVDLHKKYPEYDFIILMASRLTREKNVEMAIEAMKDISQMSNVKCQMLLLIVGDGPDREALQKSIVKCQLSNVKIEPWTNDLISYYKTADLFLLTSNYEGYGRTVVEAIAAGLPVIMTDVGLAGELLIDDLDGKIVPIRDEKSLATAILELKENPVKREEFKQNSLKLLEQWLTKKEYLEKYRNLLMMLK